MFIYVKLRSMEASRIGKLDFLLAMYSARRECVLSDVQLNSLADSLKVGGEDLSRIDDIRRQQRIFVADLRNIEPLMESLMSEEMGSILDSERVSLHAQLPEKRSPTIIPPIVPSAP